MSRGALDPVRPEVRLAIVNWPVPAPRGAVTLFCQVHGISRKTFYAIRARAEQDGAIEALMPRSRRPRESPSRTQAPVIDQALQVRSALASAGLDYGPISVMDKMRSLGLSSPSRATLARIFAAAGAVEPAPRKRPRSSYRRFVYPAPNCLWQLDGFVYPLVGGREATILQVIDDHSRMILASLAAPGETSQAVVAVVRAAVLAHGLPQRFLSDNGQALNPHRRGQRGQLMDYLQPLGVRMITGQLAKPTTQGKSERHHQTTARWLDQQEMATTLTELQSLLEEFENIYNTQRPHQALAGRCTPAAAWAATPPAPPPDPIEPAAPPIKSPTGPATRTVTARGDVAVIGHEFKLGRRFGGQVLHIQWDLQHVEFFDPQGTSILRLPRPAPGAKKYIGNGEPAGFMAHHPTNQNRHRSPETSTVTNVLRQEPSPMS